MRTMRRNLDWRDDTSLFTSAAAAYPGSAKAHYQLADGLARRGQTAEASELLRRVLAIEPDYHYAHLHLSRMALERDEPKVAVEHAAASLTAVPAPNAHGHALAARALLELHRRGEHVAGYAAVDAPEGGEGAGADRVAAMAAAAASHMRAAIATDPDAADVAAYLAALGEALSLQAKWAEAAAAFEALASRRPGDPSPMVNHAAALLQLGRRSEAASRFRRALQLIDGNSNAMVDASTVEAWRGLAEKARRGLELAAAK